MPSIVNGISSCLYIIPTVPFWPCLELNLSPICGILTDLIRTWSQNNRNELYHRERRRGVFNLHKFIAIIIGGKHDSINDTSFRGTKGNGRIFLCKPLCTNVLFIWG